MLSTTGLRAMSWLGLMLVCASLLGCKKRPEPGHTQSTSALSGQRITGAGATFPYPIYSKWGHAYHEKTGVELNYQSIGSGGGIQQIKAQTVDFGATDAPLQQAELDASGLIQFPMVVGGVVPVVHLDGVASGAMVLDGPALGGLFLGEIKKWNDERLRKLNPTLALPDREVSVVHRADASGTTWIFTKYLAQAYPSWGQKVGAEKSVNWPVGLGGKGNEGVAVYVQRINGAIGYVEYAYAVQNKMNAVRLVNAAGKTVEPTMEAFQAAAANANWKEAPGFYLVLVNQPGESSWPIAGASFVLMQKSPQNPSVAQEVLRFFDYAYRQGEQMAKELHYVPMPQSVADLVQAQWSSQLKAEGKALWPVGASAQSGK